MKLKLHRITAADAALCQPCLYKYIGACCTTHICW